MTNLHVPTDPALCGDGVNERWLKLHEAWRAIPVVQQAHAALQAHPEPRRPALRGFHWGDGQNGEKHYVHRPWEPCYDPLCKMSHSEGK